MPTARFSRADGPRRLADRSPGRGGPPDREGSTVPTPAVAQKPSWLATQLEGRKVLFVDPVDPGVVVAHIAKIGARKRVALHLTKEAKPCFDEIALERQGLALIGAVLPDPPPGKPSPYTVEMEVHVDTSLSGGVVQVTSVLRIYADRAFRLDEEPGAYLHAEVYEAPLVHGAATAYLGIDPAGEFVRTAMRESADHLARAVRASSSGPSDPLPAEGAPRKAPSESGRDSAAAIDREALIAMMRERGVIVLVEEMSDQRDLADWLHRNGMGPEHATAAVQNWIGKAGIPIFEPDAIPMDRPLPFVVSCQLQVSTLDLSGTAIGRGTLVAVSGELSVYESFALAPDGLTVASNVGVWNGAVHQSHGRMSGYDANIVFGHVSTVLTSSVRDLLGGVLPESFHAGAAAGSEAKHDRRQPRRRRRR